MNPDHDSPSTGTVGTSPGGFVPKTLFPPPLWVRDIINTLHAGYFFHAFVVVCLLFQKNIFFQKLFQQNYQSVKRFGSRSGPDLGQNCL